MRLSKRKKQNTHDTGYDINRTKVQEVWHQFKKNRGAVFCLVIVVLVVLIGIFSGVLVSYEGQVTKINGSLRLAAPSLQHPFGCDELGRDMFARVLYGTRYSLIIGFSSALIALVLGEILGVTAGYFGGLWETLVMRFTDIWSAIPITLLAVILAASMGTGMVSLIVALGVASVASFTRMARATVLTVIGNEYIEAARAAGASNFSIIVNHIIPNALSPMVVQTTMQVATSIVQAAAMSFIGLGVPVPTPEWGTLLSAGRTYMRNSPHLTLFPGLAILITVLAINVVGDGLRDALDPKLKR